jgi:hypothetical protein
VMAEPHRLIVLSGATRLPAPGKSTAKPPGDDLFSSRPQTL